MSNLRTIYKNYSLFWNVRQLDSVEVEKDLSGKIEKCLTLSKKHDRYGSHGFDTIQYGTLLHKLYAELELRSSRGLLKAGEFKQCRQVLLEELQSIDPFERKQKQFLRTFQVSCRVRVFKNPVLRNILGLYDGGERAQVESQQELARAYRLRSDGSVKV